MTDRNRKRPDRRREWLPEEFKWIPGSSRTLAKLGSKEEVQQYVVVQAQRAHNLLTDETFGEVFQELQDGLTEQMLSTMPGQKEEREDLYYRIRGLQDIATTLNAWINRYNAMVQADSTSNVGP